MNTNLWSAAVGAGVAGAFTVILRWALGLKGVTMDDGVAVAFTTIFTAIGPLAAHWVYGKVVHRDDAVRPDAK